MSEPFDLDAYLGGPFTFTFDGQEYSLPPDVSWNASELLANGKPEEALHELLGDDQWQRLEDSPKVFGPRSFTGLVDRYMAHLGLREGEAEASPPSSEPTGEQLRQTSSGSTTSTSPGSSMVLTG